MNNVKISQLPIASSVTDGDKIPLTQNGVTKSVIISVLKEMILDGINFEVVDNEEVFILATDWVDDGDGKFKATVNHPCNSEKLHVTFKKSTKENTILGYTIIDENSFEVYSDEKLELSCIISSRYVKLV